MIRNVVIHMNGEQPMLADVQSMPVPSDVCLVCSNVRYMNGNRPSFIDAIDSTFVFPLSVLRFVEIPRDSTVEMPEVMELGSGMAEEDVEMDAEAEAALLERIRAS